VLQPHSVLARSVITTVNLAEVLGVLATRAGISVSETLQTIEALPLLIVDISKSIAIQSTQLHEALPKSGLSLGERFCNSDWYCTGLAYSDSGCCLVKSYKRCRN